MKPGETQNKNLNKNVDLPGGFPSGLSAPARRAISQAGFTHLEQLSKISEAEFKKLHGIGPTALDQLRQALLDKGLSFAMETPPKNQ